MGEVGVTRWRLEAYEDGNHADTDEARAEDWYEPLHVILCSPACPDGLTFHCSRAVSIRLHTVDEEADWEEEDAWDKEGKAVFRFHFLAPGLDLFQISIRNGAEYEEADEHAHANTDVDETDDAAAEAVDALEDSRDGREDEVQVTVDERHDEGEEEDDWR